MRTVREALLRANSTSPASAMMTSDVEGAMGQGSEAIGSDVEGVEGRGGDGSAGGGHEVEDESGCSWQYVVVLTKADKVRGRICACCACTYAPFACGRAACACRAWHAHAHVARAWCACPVPGPIHTCRVGQ